MADEQPDNTAVRVALWRALHVEVDAQMTVLRSHEIAHAVKDKVRAEMPNVSDVLIHIEPLDVPAKRTSA